MTPPPPNPASPGSAPVPSEREAGGVEAEISREQAAVDRAYERLEQMRRSALGVVRHHQGLGQVGSGQSRVEWESLLALTDQRLQHLEIGGAALCFGRIDRTDGETYQVGRISVLDERGDPLVVDWRAPAAEAFYRATGRNPMGLVRRRHLLTRGRTVVGLDDEVFDLDRADASHLGIVGEGALLAALERSRTGRMGDIVATIQAEQDEIIRAPIPGILLVQGGPGTGKTAVALHRAAYLLYTNRQRLEDAGVLVVGPNRTFLRYIEHVLPSLGESGVELLTVNALYGRAGATATEDDRTAAVKGDARMAQVLARAVTDRERALPHDLEVPYGSTTLRVSRDELRRLIDQARARRGTHNARRAGFVRRLRRALWNDYRRQLERRLARSTSDEPGPTGGLDMLDGSESPELSDLVASASESRATVLEREEERFGATIGNVPELRTALERMWPLLTPAELLHDLFGAPALLRLATTGVLTDAERDTLSRPRARGVDDVRWTSADLALLDEAATILGPLPQRARRRASLRDGARWAIEDVVSDVTLPTGDLDPAMRRALIQRLEDREKAAEGEESETVWPPVYGHVIVDEAQDYSPMQWRMIARRCPVGSMTIVGDLGQASRPGSIGDWSQALAQLPVRREPRLAELTINYRTPAEIMAVAAGVLAATKPDLRPPVSVRRGGDPPRYLRLADEAAIAGAVASSVEDIHDELGEGKIAVIAPGGIVDPVRAELVARPRLDVAPANSADPLDAEVAVFAPVEAKGLEFDAVVLVEPAALAGGDAAGLRGLYVAMTRATRLLSIVHHLDLPAALAEAVPAGSADA